jgi:Gas vesicle synthesis protein GvpL/GvpF
MSSLYLYGLSDKVADVSGATGIFGNALRWFTLAGFCMIVEDVTHEQLEHKLGQGGSGTTGTVQDAALAHHETLMQLVQTIDMVPFRFGTAVSDQPQLEAFIAANAESLRQALAVIDGHLEWGIKLLREKPAAETPGAADAGNYLRAMHSRRQSGRDDDTRATHVAQTVIDTVQQQASVVLPFQSRTAETTAIRLINVTCLVKRGGDRHLLAALEAACAGAENIGIRLELSGPWPAYSFAGFAPAIESAPHVPA